MNDVVDEEDATGAEPDHGVINETFGLGIQVRSFGSF